MNKLGSPPLLFTLFIAIIEIAHGHPSYNKRLLEKVILLEYRCINDFVLFLLVLMW